jgi:hypothetical protein
MISSSADVVLFRKKIIQGLRVGLSNAKCQTRLNIHTAHDPHDPVKVTHPASREDVLNHSVANVRNLFDIFFWGMTFRLLRSQ